MNYGPDGRSLIVTYSAADLDRTTGVFMRRFDARDGTPLGRAVRVAPRSTSAAPLSSPDGRLLVSSDRATYAVDAQTLRVVRRYRVGSPRRTRRSAPTASTLALEDPGGSLRLLDLHSGRVRTLAGAAAGVRPLIGRRVRHRGLSPDGRTLATWDESGNVILWDVRKGLADRELRGPRGGCGDTGLQPRRAHPLHRR